MTSEEESSEKSQTNKMSFIKAFDLLAKPVSMTYKGKKSHPTICGGFISIWFFSFLFVFFGTRWWVLIRKEGDELS